MPYLPRVHPSKAFNQNHAVDIPFTHQGIDALHKAAAELREAGWHVYPFIGEIRHGSAKYILYYDDIKGRVFGQEFDVALTNYIPCEIKLVLGDYETFEKIEEYIMNSNKYSLEAADPETLTITLTIHGGMAKAHELSTDVVDALV